MMGGQTLCMRERLWLLAHDDEYGDLRPRVDLRAVSIGLAAATVTDLLLRERIEVQHGLVFRRDEAGPDVDPVGRRVLDLLGHGPAHRLAEVLREARTDPLDEVPTPFQRLYERTRAGLLARGYLCEQQRRLRGTRYRLAKDPDVIITLQGLISDRLVHQQQHHRADLSVDCLCALVLAMGLHQRFVTPYPPSEAEQVLLFITGQIPRRAGTQSSLTIMPQMVQIVRYAVGDLATSPF